MSITLRPWLECVELHPDVLSDEFSDDIFALDLGPLSDYLTAKEHGAPDAELARVPAVYRDAGSFFAASYLTGGLRSLLEDVLGRLAGARGNRVLKLMTPFGGGKSHTLAALLHAARSRTALDALPEAAGLPRPERVRVTVVDGQLFDATTGKRAPQADVAAKTIWGWIGWALGGPDGYALVRQQDEARVAPGGDVLIELLRRGPSLILLDEILEYLISAGGVQVGQTTLRDETLSFLKRLTVAVGSVDNAVLVYSLQSSSRESLEYTGLLRTVEHLAARKDQRREPVEGNEILNVIQRRLLAKTPDASAAGSVAEAYRQVFTRMRQAYAQGEPERRQAEEEGMALRDRISAAYPFHPALIDVMRERWAAVPDFQRTRGALRFLATCLRTAHGAGRSRLLLGPGDVPLRDSDVRLAFFMEVGQREDFQACLEHDFIGANARTRRIDGRRAQEVTSEAGKEPATRLATIMLLYSFGGLRRSGGAESEPLPPGIAESELLGVSIGPDLDSTTAQACLKELREQCLYLHFDGVNYCFKKDPNVTLLVEQEADAVTRDESRARIREMIEQRLAGQPAIVWPERSSDLPDREARFLIAYLPLEFADRSPSEQQALARDLCENHGARTREYRNGLGLAVPAGDQIVVLRRAVRYLLAVERVNNRRREHNLTAAQRGQLKERASTEQATAESALLRLYAEVRLPEAARGTLSLDTVSMGGRPLQITLDAGKRALIHQRLMELLATVQRKVFDSVAPGKIVELFHVGEESTEPGIATDRVVAGFFSFLGFPRLHSSDVVRSAIARGVETGMCGYATGRPPRGADGRYQLERSRVAFQRSLAPDEIDLDSGFLILPRALPEPEKPREKGTTPVPVYQGTGGTGEEIRDPTNTGDAPTPAPGAGREVALSFTAGSGKLFDAWRALANLADLAGEITISAKVTSTGSLDPSRLEHGVLEPLRELGLLED